MSFKKDIPEFFLFFTTTARMKSPPLVAMTQPPTIGPQMYTSMWSSSLGTGDMGDALVESVNTVM